MLHTVGEAAAEAGTRNLIVADRRHSVAGAATLATPEVAAGVHAPPVRRGGAAVAAAADGAAVDFVVVVAAGSTEVSRPGGNNERHPSEVRNG